MQFKVALEREKVLFQELDVGFTVSDQFFFEIVQGTASRLPGQFFSVPLVELSSSLEFHPFGHVELLVEDECQVQLVLGGVEEVRKEAFFEFGYRTFPGISTEAWRKKTSSR